MSEQNNTGDGDKKPQGEAPVDGQKQQSEFTPISSQDQLDALIKERIERAKASEAEKYKGYDEMKQKASEFDKLQDAQKTETQKLADQLAAEKKRADEAERKALLTKVSGGDEVLEEALKGSTLEELEASKAKILAWRDANKGGADEGTKSAGGNNRPVAKVTATGQSAGGEKSLAELVASIKR